MRASHEQHRHLARKGRAPTVRRLALLGVGFPLCWSVASGRLRKQKASRPAVTPQLRPQAKVSLPVASSVPSRGRDELLFILSVSPARRAGRRHRQRAMITTSRPGDSPSVAPAVISKLPVTLDTKGRVRTAKDQPDHQRGQSERGFPVHRHPGHELRPPLLPRAGKLTNDGRRLFEYDFENQLTNVYVASAWRSEFKYDAFGRRRVRKEYTWNSGLGTWNLTNEVRYVYDGMLTVQERDANNLAMVSYTRGNDLSGTLQGAGCIGGLLARTDHSALISQLSAAHAYYHADGNGNITALVDTNGILVARYQHDPYGNLLGMSGPLAEANTYRFSSKEWCANAGLYYYGYRFYEPNLQRWLNRDPLEEQGGINLYGFGFNNAMLWIDPFGLEIAQLPINPPMPPFGHPSSGGLFSDPKQPFGGSQNPLKDFGKACQNQAKDWLKNDEGFQDILQELKENFVNPWWPFKDLFKSESLGTGGPSKSKSAKKKNKWDVDLKWLGGTVTYDMHKYGKIQLKGGADTRGGVGDFYKIDGGGCKIEYSLSF